MTLELHGTVFFLSSSVVLGKILGHLNLPDLETLGTESAAGGGADVSEVEMSPLLGQAKRHSYNSTPNPDEVEGGRRASSPKNKMAVKYLILDCERLQVCHRKINKL